MRAWRPAHGRAGESDRDTHETRHARPRGDRARAALRVTQKRFIAATQHALSGASRQSLERPL
ncbi:hypothetical protein DIE07_24870 [Burkholderia sp. Bp9002]|nr:hypothetical protein DIE18_27410 [Burkholderia sp. Bp9125]RQS06242.1 hypothetical protein DIE07_24870 [Burkholderia sp. Bp9002]